MRITWDHRDEGYLSLRQLSVPRLAALDGRVVMHVVVMVVVVMVMLLTIGGRRGCGSIGRGSGQGAVRRWRGCSGVGGWRGASVGGGEVNAAAVYRCTHLQTDNFQNNYHYDL